MYQHKRILTGLRLSFGLRLGLSLTLGFAFSLWPGGPAFGDHPSVGESQQRVKRFRANFAGTFVNTTVDMNGDGAPAVITTSNWNSTLGPIRTQTLSETQPVLLNPSDPRSLTPCQLPNGEPGVLFELIPGSSGVGWVDRMGAAFFFEATASAICNSLRCFDETGALQAECTNGGTTQLTITGGTGKLSDASGTINVEGMGEFFVVQPTGFFGANTAQATGEIRIPR